MADDVDLGLGQFVELELQDGLGLDVVELAAECGERPVLGLLETELPSHVPALLGCGQSDCRAAHEILDAGFDGVEIHGAHGYILCQYFSDKINHRDDEYGGDLDGRFRILFEIIDGVRARCRKDFILGVRLSPERFGMKLAEVKEIAGRLLTDDRIDFLDMSLWDSFKEPEEDEHKGKSLMAHFAELKRGTTRLGAAGNIRTPEDAEKVIAAGGTGGHMFPARAFADEMRKRGWRVGLISDSRGLHYASDFPAEWKEEVFAASPNFRKPWTLPGAFLKIQAGIGMAKRIMKEKQPALVAGFGGYPAFPALAAAKADGIDAVAIVLMHAWAAPAHEEALARIAREEGFGQISVSHEVSPLIKLVGRGDTTVVDAYLSPILRRYVARVAEALGATPAGEPGPTLQFMMSSGGMTAAERFQGKDAILSGPAGGVVGMVETAVDAGFEKVIGFDMGGTSTDVAHSAGSYERAFDTEVAGVRIRAPMMRIHTVAAGGGSILHAETGRFRVGPDSAGADPGPACYRRGGRLTVTDANVMLGKLRPKFFPTVFGPGQDEALDDAVVRARFAEIAEAEGKAPEEVPEGFLTIAVENIAKAIKKISVQRGYDVTKYLLNCFGGAGGQHACLVADALGMESILIHPFSGLLSAYGIGLASVFASRQQALIKPLSEDSRTEVKMLIDQLCKGVFEELAAQGVPDASISWRPLLQLRYDGTDTTIPVAFSDQDFDAARIEFEKAHKAQFGFIYDNKTVIIEAISVEGLDDREDHRIEPEHALVSGEAEGGETRKIYSGGAWREARVIRREHLKPGHRIAGPALVIEPNQTIVIEPGWEARINARDHVVLTRYEKLDRALAIGADKADPIMLEVFNNLFMSIAEQMGVTLQNTAYSVNIKERLDFSCAVFDASGALVANAPHMPVHLGSMDRSVETVIKLNTGDIAPGDVFALNAPYNGGTHLPDITVVSPVFDDDGIEILFWAASRGHHADVGGSAPGSMTPRATTVDEEGVLIDNLKLVDRGRFREEALVEVLTDHAWPVRNVTQNVADLKAQIAANEKGVKELRKMVAHFGLDVVQAYMGHVQDNAEESVRRVI